MNRSIFYWVIKSLGPASIPLLVRLGIAFLHKSDAQIIWLDPIDLVTLGIALNIQIRYDLSEGKLDSNPYWKDVFGTLNAIILFVMAMLYAIHLLNGAKQTFLNINLLIGVTGLVALLSIVLSFQLNQFSEKLKNKP